MKTSSESLCTYAELVSAVALDNEGTEAERHAVAEHMKSCAACTRLYSEMSGTRTLIGSMRQYDAELLHPGFTPRVMDRILIGDESPVWSEVLRLSKRTVTVLGAIVLVLLTIMLFPANDPPIGFGSVELDAANGGETDVLEKEILTRDDVVALALSGR